MSALTKEQINALPEIVADAMAGPWFRNEENDVCIQIDGQHHAVCTDQFCYGSPAEKDANARLIALAPSLAATIIEQQAEIERLTAIIAVMDASSPRADHTRAEPGITLSQAVEREYPHLARATLEGKP